MTTTVEIGIGVGTTVELGIGVGTTVELGVGVGVAVAHRLPAIEKPATGVRHANKDSWDSTHDATI